jgi:hypothetical protein
VVQSVVELHWTHLLFKQILPFTLSEQSELLKHSSEQRLVIGLHFVFMLVAGLTPAEKRQFESPRH